MKLMKLKLIFTIVLSVMCNIAIAYDVREGRTIAPGAGYSSDSQQVAEQYCYDAVLGPLGDEHGDLTLDTAVSFRDLQKHLRIDVEAKGGYGMFSASAEASYLRDVEDKDYSLSLNYFEYLGADASVNLKGYGVEALNSFGKSAYQDGKNPIFGLVCGDRYFESYEVGAMLVMSISINFSSHDEKKQFEIDAKGSYGDIFSASGKVQSIATQHNMQGTVSINAFQKGGDPAQLSKILKKDPSGKYYVLTCDIQHMDNCVHAASGLLDYAVDIFPKQISFEKGTGLTPLGIGFSKYPTIDHIGLIVPKSLVTEEVKKDRLKLADELLKNRYYYQKSRELLKGYPVNWDEESDLYKHIQALYDVSGANIDVITRDDHPEKSAGECYYDPRYCAQITKDIESKLQPIDLGFLKAIEDEINIFGINEWFPYDDNNGHYRYAHDLNDYATMTFNDTNMDVQIYGVWGSDYRTMYGVLSGDYPKYKGPVFPNPQHIGPPWYNVDTEVKKNPFYFEPYKPE